MTEFSHWGFVDAMEVAKAVADDEERYIIQAEPVAQQLIPPGLILTRDGDILVHRQHNTTREDGCTVAIIIGRDRGVLTREQIVQMMRAWDLAVTMTQGRDEDVILQPVPSEWPYDRQHYALAAE